MSKKNALLLVAAVFVLTLGVSISAQSLMAAWTEPTLGAPDGNVAKPLNVGTENQEKDGVLYTKGGLRIENYDGIGNAAPVGVDDGRMWLDPNPSN